MLSFLGDDINAAFAGAGYSQIVMSFIAYVHFTQPISQRFHTSVTVARSQQLTLKELLRRLIKNGFRRVICDLMGNYWHLFAAS